MSQNDVRGHFPYQEYAHPDDHSHVPTPTPVAAEDALRTADIEVLTHAVTHLLADHDCDRHGWETLQDTNERVRAALTARLREPS